MDFKIIWSASAINDLREICEYISRENPEAGQRIGREILDHVRILEAFPLIRPNYPRRSDGSIREIVFNKYRIFYEVSEKTKSVLILHLWHGARGMPPVK